MAVCSFTHSLSYSFAACGIPAGQTVLYYGQLNFGHIIKKIGDRIQDLFSLVTGIKYL